MSSLRCNRPDDLIGPLLKLYPENVQNICYYGFTEIYNNAVDHSDGSKIGVSVKISSQTIRILIWDNGTGVFEKIRDRFGLEDHCQAILELSKGKLTTDPSRHTGQGIFFTSRMFDEFWIRSGHLFFSHEEEDDDWLIEVENKLEKGTAVKMQIATDTQKTSMDVFNKYSHRDESDEFPFSKTHVPLSLARYGEEQLVSRSQAKRLPSEIRQISRSITGVQRR